MVTDLECSCGSDMLCTRCHSVMSPVMRRVCPVACAEKLETLHDGLERLARRANQADIDRARLATDFEAKVTRIHERIADIHGRLDDAIHKGTNWDTMLDKRITRLEQLNARPAIIPAGAFWKE